LTIADSINTLIEFFNENDCFVFPQDIKQLLLIAPDGKDRQEISIQIALDKLVEEKICEKKERKDSTYYILEDKIHKRGTSVFLSYATCFSAKQILEEWSNLSGNQAIRCNNIGSLSERDIANIFHICAKLLEPSPAKE